MRTTLTLLFWNLGGEKKFDERRDRLLAVLENLSRAYHPNVVMLAECALKEDQVIKSISTRKQTFRFEGDVKDKVHLFTDLPPRRCRIIAQDGIARRLTLYHLKPTAEPVILGGIHFPDKYNMPDEKDALLEMLNYADTIRLVEDELRLTDRTILIGDFNRNPYESPMLAERSLNAKMTMGIALRAKTRAFYNPMWGYFGDQSPGPPGTHYYPKSEAGNHRWHILDQVLLRTGLIDSFESVKVLSHDGQHWPLLTRSGLPDTSITDHLPLLTRFRFA